MKRLFACLLGLSTAPVALTQSGTAQNTAASGQRVEEVIVTGQRRLDSSEITTNAQALVDVPGALGDPIGGLFSLPGVVYGDGEAGAPAVRGSSPDDNLFIVDFLPAGYVFHAFTNSVFSENIIQDFQLHSAAFGPQYSDVTGAVLDVTLRTPKHQPLKSVLDLSMLRSGVFFEGGVTAHSAAYVSVRKSLMHLFLAEDEEKDGIRFKQAPQDDDYQFKYAWDLGRNHSLTLGANGASDLGEAQFMENSDVAQSNPDFAGDALVKSRFHNQSLRWDYYGDGGDNLKAGLGHMRQDVTTRWGIGYFNSEYLEQSVLKLQYDLPLTSQHTLLLNGEYSRNEHGSAYDQILVVCNEFDPTCEDVRRGRVTDDQTIEETSHAVSLADSWRIAKNVDLNIGAQYQTNTYTGESFVNPRAALAWGFADRWALSLKGGRYNRFPDLEAVLPKIGNPRLRSPRATHFATGLKHELAHGWSWNAEAYYKTLDDLPLALGVDEPDAALLYSNDVHGRAYGVDLLIDKQPDDAAPHRWYGWFALSLAKSERTNERTGITRNYRLDTPLVANWVANYRFTQRFDAGLRFSLRSGKAYTPIVGARENPDFAGYVQPVYGDAFADRFPAYSRLDLRFKYAFDIAGYDSAVILDVINALNAQNVEGRHLDYQRTASTGRVYLVDDVGFELFPALTFRITF